LRTAHSNPRREGLRLLDEQADLALYKKRTYENAMNIAFTQEMARDRVGRKLSMISCLLAKRFYPDSYVVLKNEEKLAYNIGRAFKRENLVEFLGKNEAFSPFHFNKFIGQAYLHAVDANKKVSDVTVTAIVIERPACFFRFLNENKESYPMTSISQGITHIQAGPLLFQLVECRKLDFEENAWLRSLADPHYNEKACLRIYSEPCARGLWSQDSYYEIYRSKEDVKKHLGSYEGNVW
jgi:hypothetical protein